MKGQYGTVREEVIKEHNGKEGYLQAMPLPNLNEFGGSQTEYFENKFF